MIDFKGVYYDARCLLQHIDPYQYGVPARVYLAEQKDRPLLSDVLRQVLSLNIYLPTTSIFITPFAMLPWGLAPWSPACPTKLSFAPIRRFKADRAKVLVVRGRQNHDWLQPAFQPAL